MKRQLTKVFLKTCGLFQAWLVSFLFFPSLNCFSENMLSIRMLVDRRIWSMWDTAGLRGSRSSPQSRPLPDSQSHARSAADYSRAFHLFWRRINVPCRSSQYSFRIQLKWISLWEKLLVCERRTHAINTTTAHLCYPFTGQHQTQSIHILCRLFFFVRRWRLLDYTLNWHWMGRSGW